LVRDAMKQAVVVLATVATTIACLPVVENLTTHRPVDPALSEEVADDGGLLLVLPVWFDDGPCNIRSAFTMPANEILSLDERLPSRRRLGTVDMMGHGPSHFRSTTGILIISTTGRAIWVDSLRYPQPDSPDVYWRPQYTAQLGNAWSAQLSAWLVGCVATPALIAELTSLREVCEDFHAILPKSETSVAGEFLAALKLPESSPGDERWQGI